ncbi:uncharacterized protein PRCAT00005260001 [Priceomyces carsonii]|uniref:uncharacterized protein n=1 Tax=Priceomyces carsonii TaxID=28549 RepID=UPI002ED9FE3D|nr:unnamed protein product [Priceomyces carsonii]
MDPIASYFILSLPQSTDAHEWLEESLLGGKCPLFKLNLPDFQIGTLDSLVEESEELSKLDSILGQSVSKIVDILKSIQDSPSRVVQSRQVTDYVESFQWNTSKYRLDKQINQLSKAISSDALTLDNDVKTTYQSYQTAKSNYQAAERKKNGDLSIKSLHEIVKPDQFVLGSDHLTTLLIAVPKNLKGDFEHSYETLTQFVIPRSANIIAKDNEYILFAVTLFKKYEQEFISAAREHKWHPRTDFTYSEETLNNQREEFDLAKASESKTKNDLVRLAKTAYSDIFLAWLHIKVMRVYVESVLRYGLPPQFNYTLIKFEKSNVKNLDKAKKELIDKFGYLGGDGFSSKSNLHDYASLVETDYMPFVLYDLVVV